jgi:16S rRNA (guanine527-N7)-methyltransferase
MPNSLPPAIQVLGPRLEAGLHQLGLTLSPHQQTQCLQYLSLLLHWNQTYNLTAIRTPEDALIRHVLDSLAIVLPLARRNAHRPISLLDVGSGGGLPGLLLAIARPDWSVTCIDAVAKKMAFIRQAAAQLQLPHVQAIHARVEVWQSAGSGHFDWVISRAFSSLADFVNLSRFHVKQTSPPLSSSLPSYLASSSFPSTGWLVMKGLPPMTELPLLPADITHEMESIEVPGLEAKRCLVWLYQSLA